MQTDDSSEIYWQQWKRDIERLSQTPEQASIGRDKRRRVEVINQCSVIDHHCGPTLYWSVHGIGPKHSVIAASALMMLAGGLWKT